MLIQPKANDVMHLCQLITGDRFYCKSDEKKTVWELRFHTVIKLRGDFKKLSQCRNGKGERVRLDANRVVVFLRRTRTVVKKKPNYSIDNFFA